jgi:hypothetical protein
MTSNGNLYNLKIINNLNLKIFLFIFFVNFELKYLKVRFSEVRFLKYQLYFNKAHKRLLQNMKNPLK